MKHIPVIVALALVIIGFLPASKPATGPVADAMANASREDRAKLARIYTGLAAVTKRAAGKDITTVGVWRDVHSATLRMAVGEMKGKYPGLDVAVEKVLQDHVLKEDVPLTGEALDGLIDGCLEVAKQSG